MPQISTPEFTPLANPVLPQMDDSLVGDALTVTELGAWLLASSGFPLLCVPLGVARKGLGCAAVPMRLDTGADVAAGLAIATAKFNRSLLLRLTAAADALFADLATRWPAYAAPPLIALVTDGTGLALSPDDPWPLSPDWLQRQARGAASLVEIVPFDAAGAWARSVIEQ